MQNRNQNKMPVLFLGHGSPMNAIENNDFTQTMKKLGEDLPRPQSILMVSAHWMTKGTYVTGMRQPKTIHDFYGFPRALFDVQYPAPGYPELAVAIRHQVDDPVVHIDNQEWGLDHGTWSVLRHLYSEAQIPVVQLSLDMSKPAAYHFALGQKLQKLREQGVMIMGSGNIVHNLQEISWQTDAPAYDWALEFDQIAKNKLIQRDFKYLMNDFHATESGKLSVPTMDHYLPLMYVLGAATEKDEMSFPYEGMQNASISMRAVQFG